MGVAHANFNLFSQSTPDGGGEGVVVVKFSFSVKVLCVCLITVKPQATTSVR